MKTQSHDKPIGMLFRTLLQIALPVWLAFGAGAAHASIAYGSINNFDTVNDTGVPCHGFEIELDDIRSIDITYTYDWNHYGTPKIIEDTTTVPGHTNVIVRYLAVMTTNGWSAYTAVPMGPIAPTAGHQFTDPSVNFGGEHFGVGYNNSPSAVKYNWLIDNGAGVLTLGPAVNVSTPTFTYIPPAGAVPAQVQAAIVPPPPPVLPVREFGDVSWVKEIRTTTHNNHEVRLRDLITADTNNPAAKDWRNGEPDEVEVEWQIMQIDYNSANGGANGELKAAPESLNQGDEVVTRRYEFYEYLGPLNPETGEALAQSVGADGIHGSALSIYSNTVVVGKFIGSQMSAYSAVTPLGLIDHLPDGSVGTAYPTRGLVITADTNFTVVTTGGLPDGMAFDPASGQVYGTPWTAGDYLFHVEVSGTNSITVAKTYAFAIAPDGVDLPPHTSVDTSSLPFAAGETAGDGVYNVGDPVIATAVPKAGYHFLNWTDNGTVVSVSATLQYTNDFNRSLTANFATNGANESAVALLASPANAGLVTGDRVYTNGSSATVTAIPGNGYAFAYWADGVTSLPVSSNASYMFTVGTDILLVAEFVTNTPPVAAGGSFYQLTNQALAINISDLLLNDYDPDGGPVTFTGLSATTANGLPLTTNATQILVPTNSVADSFTYTIADTNGLSATGIGTISITTNAAAKAPSLDLGVPGAVRGGSTAVPWHYYTLKRAANVTFTNGVRIWLVQADQKGVISFLDDFSDLGGQPSQAFYMLIHSH